jgi:hypothetical protein
MLNRSAFSTALRLAQGFPVLAITGPRQSGKTIKGTGVELFWCKVGLTENEIDSGTFS